MRGILAFLLVLFLLGLAAAGVAVAQSQRSGEPFRMGDWQVAKFQTPRDGLSCQAFKCSRLPCNADDAEATLRFFGSNRRRAVTPMIGMKVTKAGASDAVLEVGGARFALEQASGSLGKLFIAKDASDDARIMRLVIANPNGEMRFSSRKGQAVFQLRGIRRVLRFFERECSIPLG